LDLTQLSVFINLSLFSELSFENISIILEKREKKERFRYKCKVTFLWEGKWGDSPEKKLPIISMNEEIMGKKRGKTWVVQNYINSGGILGTPPQWSGHPFYSIFLEIRSVNHVHFMINYKVIGSLVVPMWIKKRDLAPHVSLGFDVAVAKDNHDIFTFAACKFF